LLDCILSSLNLFEATMRFGIRLFSLALLLVSATPLLVAQTPQPVDVAVDSTRSYPEHDEFVPVEEEPQFDMDEVYRNLKYPEIARRNGVEGIVAIEILIDEEGRVVKYLIVRSDSQYLDEAATRALLGTSFTPAKRGGTPIATWITVPIRFRIH
jgi:protein TonB